MSRTYYVITTSLPKSRSVKQPDGAFTDQVMTDPAGAIIYEKNYLCKVTRLGKATVNVWDTDKQYVHLFHSKERAKEILPLLGTDGLTVEPFIIHHNKQENNEPSTKI